MEGAAALNVVEQTPVGDIAKNSLSAWKGAAMSQPDFLDSPLLVHPRFFALGASWSYLSKG